MTSVIGQGSKWENGRGRSTMIEGLRERGHGERSGESGHGRRVMGEVSWEKGQGKGVPEDT